jgi:hypothetical protein
MNLAGDASELSPAAFCDGLRRLAYVLIESEAEEH